MGGVNNRGGALITNALEYARKHVYFWQSSPIAGAFDDAKYPFIRKPLLSLDDIDVRETVIYGPAQSFKSVFLQIATAYRLAVAQNTVLAVAQSDDLAEEFAKVKLNPFLERLPHLFNSQVVKHTIGLWRWPNHELIICGPSENQQQSKSCRFLHTDEGHIYKYGALAALTDRMGQRWNRHGLHVTTAADSGTEIDTKFHQGNCAEWHVRCIHCNALFQPLWEDESRRVYNGHRVFQWLDNGSETETLDSIRFVCPHCDKPIENRPRNRVEMDDGADYISGNPGADRSTISFRWNAFASRFKPLRDLLSIYLKAIESAKLGDFEPFKNWKKKQEVITWKGELPDIGITTIGRDYATGQIEVKEPDLVVGSFDVQSKNGFHIWALADIWHEDGDSKRIAYDKLFSFDDLRAWQLKHGIKDFNPKTCKHPAMIGDCRHKQQEVFAAAARWNWLAAQSDDAEGFAHIIQRRNLPELTIMKPWSKVMPGDSMIGRNLEKGRPRYCPLITWSIPRMYPFFHALKNNETPRKYSIATDISQDFVDQVHSYIKSTSFDKKTNSKESETFRKIKKDDHAFICGTQSLMLAMIHGVYSVPDFT